MATSMLVNLSSLLDNAKCFALVRKHRWPDGVWFPLGDRRAGRAPQNSHNGYGCKTVLTDTGKIALDVPRERLGPSTRNSAPSISAAFPASTRRSSRLYACGMSVREIRGHRRELYGIEVSPDLVSADTDAELDEVAEWQDCPPEPLYPLVFFDALRDKVRDEGTVRNKAVHVALGVRPDGTTERMPAMAVNGRRPGSATRLT